MDRSLDGLEQQKSLSIARPAQQMDGQTLSIRQSNRIEQRLLTEALIPRDSVCLASVFRLHTQLYKQESERANERTNSISPEQSAGVGLLYSSQRTDDRTDEAAPEAVGGQFNMRPPLSFSFLLSFLVSIQHGRPFSLFLLSLSLSTFICPAHCFCQLT